MLGVNHFAVVVTALASFLVAEVDSVACSSEPYHINVETSADVDNLRDEMNCTGARAFSVSWNNIITINKTIEVSHGKNLTVTGVKDGNQNEIDAEGIDGIFSVSNKSTLVLEHLLLRGGHSTGTGGAIAIKLDSFVRVGNCNFIGNRALIAGGAISVASSTLYLTGLNSFINNSASLNGGAVAISEESEVKINDIDAFNNTGNQRGGVFNVLLSSIEFNGNVNFARNSAKLSGGAINGHNAVISFNSTAVLAWNSAEDGGAINANKSEININDVTTFEGNSASMNGGAINADDCTTTIRFLTNFNNNSARSGGAVVSTSESNIRFRGNASFYNNSAVAGGGAMLITAPDELDLSGSTFIHNKAEFGGAVSLTSTQEETRYFEECHFERNEATDGGALYLYTGAGTAAVQRSRFVENYARISGGAIFHTGSMTLDKCTFTSNEAGDEGLAVISIGLLQSMANVTFEHNTLHCPTGEYGYMNKTENGSVADSRFDMACARCSTGSEIKADEAEVVDRNRTPVCQLLPLGADETATGITLESIILLEGYYRNNETSTDVRECYRKEACKGGHTAEQYCADGYKGPYCAVCVEDYAQGISYSCSKCSDANKRWAVALAVFIALAALLATTILLAYLGKGTVEWEQENMEGRKCWGRLYLNSHDLLLKVFPLTAIKIVVVVWQIVSQFAAIAGNIYPQEYEDFLSALSPINFDIGLISAYSCMMSTNFYDRLLLATIAPIVVLGLLMCTYVIAKIRNRGSELALRRVKHKHLSAALFVAFFVYSSVSYTVLQTFVCDKMDGGESFLRADYDLPCNTKAYRRYKLYAIFMVCIYPVGIPAAFTFWLARNGKDLVKPGRDDMLHLQTARDIWSAYKPSRFYYEVVECARRITLTGIAVFVLPNSPAQIAVVLLLAVVFLFVSESLCPFEKRADMGLYRWGNGIILASMYVALLLKVDVSGDESHTFSAFAGVLIAANICMVLTVFVQAILLVRDWLVVKSRARFGMPAVPSAIPVFVLDVRSAGEEDEQYTWSSDIIGYGLPIKRATIVPDPVGSPRRPAPFKKQSCFRSTSQGEVLK